MTEQEWFSCTHPSLLFEFLGRDGRFRSPVGEDSLRRLRLFACACLAPLRQQGSEVFKTAIETAERFADGMASLEELETARKAAALLADPEGEQWYADRAWMQPDAESSALALVAAPDPRDAVRVLLSQGGNALASICEADEQDGLGTFPGLVCQLLRCIFHDPFRESAVDPGWLTWNDGMIPRLAQTIYDERSFQELPILADALEEGGCRDTAILGHLRGSGPHARGCGALDLILGKQDQPRTRYLVYGGCAEYNEPYNPCGFASGYAYRIVQATSHQGAMRIACEEGGGPLNSSGFSEAWACYHFFGGDISFSAEGLRALATEAEEFPCQGADRQYVVFVPVQGTESVARGVPYFGNFTHKIVAAADRKAALLPAVSKTYGTRYYSLSATFLRKLADIVDRPESVPYPCDAVRWHEITESNMYSLGADPSGE